MLSEGMYLSDRYEVVNKIGAGGMSDVYKAKDHILGRFVAIKVLKQEFSEDMNFVTKFRTEAQSAAALEHPNIVNIYDVGSENGMHFIVMEYVEGITLKTYIEKKQQLSYKESVSIAIQVARGIEAAHAKNIIHRDIKPQNIIISTEGKVKVTDFGIAKAASSNTISSDVMGSVHYASPEQARNGFVDGRSDIYSLGIMMYEMVTGRVPYDGDTTVAVAIQHLQEDMTSPKEYAPELPISMEKIILKCTQKNPDRRYQNIVEVLTDLRKSLINPDEDFVVIAPPAMDATKTKIIGEDELKQITESTEDSEEKEVLEGQEAEEEEEDDEDGLSPKMEKAMTIGGIVVFVLLIVAIILLIGNIAGLFKRGEKNPSVTPSQTTETESQKEEEKVLMIDLTGMTVEEANAKLEEEGYTEIKVFVYANEPNDKYEQGQIISQDPKAGREISKKGTVNVTICGEDTSMVTVPSVVDITDEAAMSTLQNAGLTVERDFENSSTVEAGKVISQSPTAGSKIAKKGTVKIIVSRGEAPVKVPDVIGLDKDAAKTKLEGEGLTVKIEEKNDATVAAGKVISQSVDNGKEVPKGTEVTIAVSLGAEKHEYTVSYNFQVPTGATKIEVTICNGNGSVIDTMTAEVSGSTYAYKYGSTVSDKDKVLNVRFFKKVAGADGAADTEEEITSAAKTGLTPDFTEKK